MKFSTQEEYGLRCLLRIAREGGEKGLTIPEISESEGITPANTAKLLRIMRIGGLLDSSRGQAGGYSLNRPAENIFINEVLDVLGGRLYDQEFCSNHTRTTDVCTNNIDCSIRSLWQKVQDAVDGVTKQLTLKDLISVPENLVSIISKGDKEFIDVSN